jgi:hypothetical protein
VAYSKANKGEETRTAAKGKTGSAMERARGVSVHAPGCDSV